MANSEVFSFIWKILQKKMVFSDYSAIMILKVSVYRFNLNPRDISGNFDRIINKGECIDFEFSWKMS